MLEELKQEVWKCNLELPKNGLVVMTSGNVSGRDIHTGYVVIKPSGYSYEKLKSEDMVVLDLEGKIIEGHLAPSIDTATHLYLYRNRPDIHGICHTHSTFASTFAVLGETIPPYVTTSALLGGEVPLGKFVPIGGDNIAQEILDTIGDKFAIIMQNHGVFTIGHDARHATKVAVELEEVAKITYFALLRGNPIRLSEEQLRETSGMYTNEYGQSPT
jgi:L-ribulose-5-phosphate 4-epimerase